MCGCLALNLAAHLRVGSDVQIQDDGFVLNRVIARHMLNHVMYNDNVKGPRRGTQAVRRRAILTILYDRVVVGGSILIGGSRRRDFNGRLSLVFPSPLDTR